MIIFDWGPLFLQAVPITLVLLMESYAIARSLAGKHKELRILNANQELVSFILAMIFILILILILVQKSM